MAIEYMPITVEFTEQQGARVKKKLLELGLTPGQIAEFADTFISILGDTYLNIELHGEVHRIKIGDTAVVEYDDEE